MSLAKFYGARAGATADLNGRTRRPMVARPAEQYLSPPIETTASPRDVGNLSHVHHRHNFAIWVLKHGPSRRERLSLYYCLRCNWAFSVNARGAVVPIDSEGRRIDGPEAAERMASFALGPCPRFTSVVPDQRPTQAFRPSRLFAGRLAVLVLALGHGWQALVGRLHS
jgi:hypothetical protein